MIWVFQFLIITWNKKKQCYECKVFFRNKNLKYAVLPYSNETKEVLRFALNVLKYHYSKGFFEWDVLGSLIYNTPKNRVLFEGIIKYDNN